MYAVSQSPETLEKCYLHFSNFLKLQYIGDYTSLIILDYIHSHTRQVIHNISQLRGKFVNLGRYVILHNISGFKLGPT